MKKLNKFISVLTAMFLCFALTMGFVPLEASAFGSRTIDSVTINFSMPPVNAADVSALSASTATGGCYISSMAWYDIYGQRITNKFTGDNATVEIVVTAAAGNYFSSGVSVTVNGAAAAVQNYGTELRISNTFSPVIWAPTMVKHPGSETVKEGGVASFVSYSACTDKSSWQILDTSGSLLSADAFAEKYPGLVVETSFDKLNISPVTMELDGYKVRCCFTGPGGTVNSNYAEIKVEPNPYGTPAELPSVQVSASPTIDHEHIYSSMLTYDAGYHWYACECGEQLNVEDHKFVWIQKLPATPDSPGLIQGECSSCGYIMTARPEMSPLDALEAVQEAYEQNATDAQEEEELIETEEPESEKPGFFKRIISFLFT